MLSFKDANFKNEVLIGLACGEVVLNYRISFQRPAEGRRL